MRILYLNNIRGFTNTFIPISTMNFFVGENSTGKSSILSLVKLMSRPKFWSHDEFNSEEVVLGFFDELVNNTNGDKSYFEIGYFNDDYFMGHGDDPYSHILAKYSDENGEPKLSELKFLIRDQSVSVVFLDGKITFKVKTFPLKLSDQNNPDEKFKRWIADRDFSNCIENEADFPARVFMGRDFFRLREIMVNHIGFNQPRWYRTRPHFIPSVKWGAPIRTKPRRLYESFKKTYSPEGIHTPLLLKNVLANNLKKTVTTGQFSKAIKKFGKNSNLFDKIEIENLGKNSSSSPFIVYVYLGDIPLKITNVGYGIGQVLPLLTEILVSEKQSWFSIQQPEVHLHPRAQAALGEFLHSASLHKKQNFLIETHSDFVIDRYRLCLKKMKTKVDSQVLFFERKGNKNIVSPIRIYPDGQFEEKQPKSFRNFFIKEQMELIKI